MKYTTTQEFNLKEELKVLKISQSALARVAGINGTFVNLAMNGRRTMAGKTASKLFSALEKIKGDEKLQEELRRFTARSNKGGGKLTPEQKIEIIERRREGEKLHLIGGLYKVSKQTIANVVKDDEECQQFGYKKKELLKVL